MDVEDNDVKTKIPIHHQRRKCTPRTQVFGDYVYADILGSSGKEESNDSGPGALMLWFRLRFNKR